MGKYDGYLIATDFDGTFAAPGAVISRENSQAIRHFQKNGGMFTIASGRIPTFLTRYKDDFVANAPLIATNGTVICDPETLEIMHCMPFGDDIDDFVAYLYQMEKVDRLLISSTGTSNANLLLPGSEGDKIWLNTREQPHSPDLYKDVSKPWCRLLCTQSPEDTLWLRDHLIANYGDQYEFCRSYASGLEIIAKDSGKGACLKWIRNYLGERIHTTIGVGDYENDISLIRDADIGYAVANAIDECKAVADRITVANTEHAIARIIDEIG